MSNSYSQLRTTFETNPDALHRCADRILALRKAMAPIRAHRSEASLLLATWNLRDFDDNKFGYGPRQAESFYYIAEVISSFDLVAIQEVNRSLTPLYRVMEILGGGWDYIVTDTTEGASGNNERMAFLFDKDKVSFRKVAGEVVLPDRKRIFKPSEATVDAAAPPEPFGNGQFARTPLLAAFKSGWFNFTLCSVHIYYGAESGERLQRRIQEIERLVTFFADRQDKELAADRSAALATTGSFSPTEAENYILVGAFNDPEQRTAQTLKKRGFVNPVAATATASDETYPFDDQIIVRVADLRFHAETGGMVDVFDSVFRDDDLETYRPAFEAARMRRGYDDDASSHPKDSGYYAMWRTFQISDHKPVWVKINVDFADDYLENLIKNAATKSPPTT